MRPDEDVPDGRSERNAPAERWGFQGHRVKYQIKRTARGQESVVATGSQRQMRARLRQLRASTIRGVSGRGGKKYRATYTLEPVGIDD